MPCLPCGVKSYVLSFSLIISKKKLTDLCRFLFRIRKAYPSLKPLASWVIDLIQRVEFVQSWVDNGIPSVFWISGFFFPQAFLTGTLQNFARKNVVSIDTVSFGFQVRNSRSKKKDFHLKSFQVMKDAAKDLTQAPADGCYIRGLFVEGARWDSALHALGESRPKELFTDMPTIWLQPEQNRQVLSSGIYMCPVYKTLTRAGTLSTTGHSTNFVFTIEIPSSKSQKYWIKRGVALICALNY